MVIPNWAAYLMHVVWYILVMQKHALHMQYMTILLQKQIGCFWPQSGYPSYRLLMQTGGLFTF